MIGKVDYEERMILGPAKVVQVSEENILSIAKEFSWTVFFTGKVAFLQPKTGHAIRTGEWITSGGKRVDQESFESEKSDESLFERFPLWVSEKYPDMLGMCTDNGQNVWVLSSEGTMEYFLVKDTTLYGKTRGEKFAIEYIAHMNRAKTITS